MRKVMLIMILLIFPAFLIAQESYRKMLVDGRTWNMMYITGNYTEQGLLLDTTYSSYTFEIVGDTIVEGRPCYKTKDNEYAYESDGKVYWYGKYRKNKWVLFFDFNLKIGDIFYQDEILKEVEFLTVSSIDTIQVNGQNYRRFYFKELHNSINGWIEGIGNKCLGLFFYPFMPVMGIDYLDMKCLSVYDGDKCIFTYEDFTKEAYHSEPVGINAVQASNSSVPLFDLQGRRIQGKPQGKGVYVRGGKKYVKK